VSETAHPKDPDLFAPAPRSVWPRLQPTIVAAVFVGGCLGGLVRYAATQHWSTSAYGFPWPVFVVNVGGAFVLALLIVVTSDVLGGSTYLRPLIGTGFCGALTTFSSVVVVVDQLIAHGHTGLAVTYLLGTIAAGLAAGAIGIVIGRSVASHRRRADTSGSA
jgi:CrcB protein